MKKLTGEVERSKGVVLVFATSKARRNWKRVFGRKRPARADERKEEGGDGAEKRKKKNFHDYKRTE
jgi:hypothetical protein